MSTSSNLCLELCHQVVEALKTPVLVLNPERKVLHANAAAITLAGQSLPEGDPADLTALFDLSETMITLKRDYLT